MKISAKLVLLALMSTVAVGTANAATTTDASKTTAPAAVTNASDQDVLVRYYSKVLTNEGVLRESRYEENMLRRQGHVWVERVLPKEVAHVASNASIKKVAHQEKEEHKGFNHTVIPRHVLLENGKVRLEYVDSVNRQIIDIPQAEYDNVNFDGSWANAYFLIDPQQLAKLPISSRKSEVAGARWRERDSAEVFQRVLWDDKRQIPLIVESGDKAGRFFNRIEVTVKENRRQDLPWLNRQGYGKKEYSDFLD